MSLNSDTTLWLIWELSTTEASGTTFLSELFNDLCIRLLWYDYFITSDVPEEQALNSRGTKGPIQKELYNLTSNIKTYKREAEALRQAKDGFEKAFDAKNADIRRSLSTELERIH